MTTFPSAVSLADFIAGIKTQIDSDYPPRWITGEIASVTRAASGHCYFSLKDEAVAVRAVLWRAKAFLFHGLLKEGAHVDVLARPTLYEARGEFQLLVEAVRLCGTGRLHEQFLKLKAKLDAEGLFDAARKRPLPRWPATVGLVTSRQGAALRDVIAVFRRRNPTISLILYPTVVQGEDAGDRIATAIRTASRRAECDALIVCRGGGSPDDLAAFDDEAIARAIAETVMPVVAGIGHETDFTIADFVADLRAATPTAAAEALAPSIAGTRERLSIAANRLTRAALARLQIAEIRLDRASLRLLSPRERVNRQCRRLAETLKTLQTLVDRQTTSFESRHRGAIARLTRTTPIVHPMKRRLDELVGRMRNSTRQILLCKTAELSDCKTALKILDPIALLSRGYSITVDMQGRTITDSTSIKIGERITTKLYKGHLISQLVDPDITDISQEIKINE